MDTATLQILAMGVFLLAVIAVVNWLERREDKSPPEGGE
jgi:hypothetical protein